jgi:fructokinase
VSEVAIGVDLGGTKIEAIALDAQSHERWRRRVATPQGDYDATVRDVIVLGGGLSQVASLYRDVPALLQRSVFASAGADPLRVDLRRSVHGDSSGVRGAAWLWRTTGLSSSSA